jgi:hypothetical protein
MERRTARNWYLWLWLSPLLTLPTLGLLLFQGIGHDLICRGGACDWDAADRVTLLIAVLGSALWHLILLIPALDKEHPFVRWHGGQALLLAGVRTAVPLAVGMAFGTALGSLLFIPVQIAIWFGGTLWGQLQAARGECSLMRWLGQGELLASLQRADPETQVEAMDPDALVEIIRYSRDPKQRRAALSALERKRMVESL